MTMVVTLDTTEELVYRLGQMNFLNFCELVKKRYFDLREAAHNVIKSRGNRLTHMQAN